MRISWRDLITTLSAGGAITLEYAYFHNWDWPLVSSMNWVLAGLGVLGLIAVIVGFSYDKYASGAWSYIAAFWSFATIAVAGLGMAYEISDYVVIMMLDVVAAWFVSVIHHFTENTTPRSLHIPT